MSSVVAVFLSVSALCMQGRPETLRLRSDAGQAWAMSSSYRGTVKERRHESSFGPGEQWAALGQAMTWGRLLGMGSVPPRAGDGLHGECRSWDGARAHWGTGQCWPGDSLKDNLLMRGW